MIIIIIGKPFLSSSGNTLSKENTLPRLAGYKLPAVSCQKKHSCASSLSVTFKNQWLQMKWKNNWVKAIFSYEGTNRYLIL